MVTKWLTAGSIGQQWERKRWGIKMDEMIARYIIENFSDKELYRDNKSVLEWIEQARQYLEARRLDF